MTRPSRRSILAGAGAWAVASPLGAAVRFRAGGQAIVVASHTEVAPLYVDPEDWIGVKRAAGDLAADIGRVCGSSAKVVEGAPAKGRVVIVAGTLGRNRTIDALAATGRIAVEDIRGKWESFVFQTVANPLPGVDMAVVVAGSDKRGAIYGLYEISRQIGVSPWYWWADVPVRRRETLALKAGRYVQGPPRVKYRGIFLNDEQPCLGGWTTKTFGGMNARFYTRVFELLLRLRANYLWPAMWNNAFATDDPDNPRLADEYGIVMGTSHHEPMARAHQEWVTHKAEYGNGEWNYATNADGVRRFFREGMERNRGREMLVTVGMRGDGDVAMASTGGMQSDIRALEAIMADQRAIIRDTLDVAPEAQPQLWALFTEVQKYYDAGLKVPDDVTLLFTDDNVGDLRRVPTAAERGRAGGAGIYFHMDMNGGPFSYKWLNSNPLPKIWEQMNLALEYGADRIWIANVGDLKPLEIPIDFFLSLAWDPSCVKDRDVRDWTRNWAETQFGPENAAAIAGIVARYAKYNGWRKPELVKPDTYSLENFREAEAVTAKWTDLQADAEAVAAKLAPEMADAYYQLVLHPVKASATVTLMQVAARRNEIFARQGRAATNDEAALVKTLFARDKALTDYYNHTLSGGKWQHMMDQVHLGYFAWYTPPNNIMPAVTERDLPDTAEFGVALEGSTEAWPIYPPANLPVFDRLGCDRHYIEVFPRGARDPVFDITAGAPWIRIETGKAFSSGSRDRRVWVSIAWAKLPPGRTTSKVTITGGGQSVDVNIVAVNATPEQLAAARGCFGGLDGPVSVAPARAARNVRVSGGGWEAIPDYGRVEAALSVFPVTAGPFTPDAAPYVEYPVFFARPGRYEILLVTSPTLNVIPTRQLSVGVRLGDGAVDIVSTFSPERYATEDFLGAAYDENTRNNARILRFAKTVESAGVLPLRIVAIDPTVVLQKIVITDKPLPPSYFGPPERPAHEALA